MASGASRTGPRNSMKPFVCVCTATVAASANLCSVHSFRLSRADPKAFFTLIEVGPELFSSFALVLVRNRSERGVRSFPENQPRSLSIWKAEVGKLDVIRILAVDCVNGSPSESFGTRVLGTEWCGPLG